MQLRRSGRRWNFLASSTRSRHSWHRRTNGYKLKYKMVTLKSFKYNWLYNKTLDEKIYIHEWFTSYFENIFYKTFNINIFNFRKTEETKKNLKYKEIKWNFLNFWLFGFRHESEKAIFLELGLRVMKRVITIDFFQKGTTVNSPKTKFTLFNE